MYRRAVVTKGRDSRGEEERLQLPVGDRDKVVPVEAVEEG
jgi:hypothetical protein